MLYYDNEFVTNDGVLVECKFCQVSRYCDPNTGMSMHKLVPVKAIFYLPTIPRLQRIFAYINCMTHDVAP